MMKFKDKASERGKVKLSGAIEPGDELNPEKEPELYEALRDFRLSVCAWSEAAMNRPRAVMETGRRWSWQLATVLVLVCMLIAGGVSDGIYRHLHRQLTASLEQPQQEMRIDAPHAVEPARPVVVQRNRPAHEEEEDLLAKVDSDVSREVPVAMEPLAQLMAGDETR
jgi:hypothetical protein